MGVIKSLSGLLCGCWLLLAIPAVAAAQELGGVLVYVNQPNSDGTAVEKQEEVEQVKAAEEAVHAQVTGRQQHLPGVAGEDVPASLSSSSATKPFLFISVGSAPQHYSLRNAIRESWLADRDLGFEWDYRFFTEQEEEPQEPSAVDSDPEDAVSSQSSMKDATTDDLVYQPKENGGYRHFGLRGLTQMKWAIAHYPQMTHYLRVDDDGFLCIETLARDLMAFKDVKKLFWGKYWCSQAASRRADENFMLFSADLLQFMVHAWDFFPYSNDWTLAMNFGYWANLMDGINIVDDRERIHSQQGYLAETSYMRNNREGEKYLKNSPQVFGDFCAKALWAHHVTDKAVRAVQQHMDIKKQQLVAAKSGEVAELPKPPSPKLNFVCGGAKASYGAIPIKGPEGGLPAYYLPAYADITPRCGKKPAMSSTVEGWLRSGVDGSNSSGSSSEGGGERRQSEQAP